MEKSKALIKDILFSLKNDYQVSDIRTCVYWTAVTSLGCGLASTLAVLIPVSERNQVEQAGNLLPSGAKELAQLSFSPRILEASIGLASINSIISVGKSRYLELNAEEEIVFRGRGKRIAVIGHFPFVNKLRTIAEKLWVFELPGRGRPGDLTGKEIETLLPQAEVVAITSTTLINHTLGGILALVAPQAYKIMLGPSTPLSPVLFDYGFNTIAGSVVVDRDLVLRSISQGANFRQVQGVKKIVLRR